MKNIFTTILIILMMLFVQACDKTADEVITADPSEEASDESTIEEVANTPSAEEDGVVPPIPELPGGTTPGDGGGGTGPEVTPEDRCWDTGSSHTDTGKSCGNDGNITTTTEGDCRVVIQTQCELKKAINVTSGCFFNFCNCVDVKISDDCPAVTL